MEDIGIEAPDSDVEDIGNEPMSLDDEDDVQPLLGGKRKKKAKTSQQSQRYLLHFIYWCHLTTTPPK